MNKKLVAKELVKVAKLLTAASNLMDSVIPENKFLELEDRVDEQTWDLAVEVYRKLKDDMQLDSNQSEALSRLMQCVERDFKPELSRNNIFKAAHALGIKLPSASF